jgi:hypothetical protein
MKLVNVHIQNYRCISDSGEIPIDDAVTCLVGKNESGKTAFLRALHLLRPLNPLRGKTKFDDVLDVPAKDSRALKQQLTSTTLPNVITARFELSPKEVAALEAECGAGVVKEKAITVRKGYGTTTYYDVNVDERSAMQHLLKTVQLPDDQKAGAEKVANVTQLKEFLASIAEPHSTITALLAKITAWREGSLNAYLIDTFLSPWLPKFFYFDEYSVMPGRAALSQLQQRKAASQLTEGEKAFDAFLGIGGADLTALQTGTRTEALIRELENAGIGITAEAMQFWSQNEGLRVLVRESQADPNDEDANLRSGQIINLRIENLAQHGVTSPFDERSRGFVWFFSFIAYFSSIEREHPEQTVILLLDEPGLSLHGAAQADFMRFINERLAVNHQVIYTTHSPFMVEPDRFDRVRTVEDLPPDGTKVSTDIFRSQPGTSLPLLTKMGVDLFQSLMVGPNTMLLEGGSDYLYMRLLSRELLRRGRVGLDVRWVLTPVSGVGKFEPFFRLYEANKINVVVLMDASTYDKRLADELRRGESSGRVVTIGEILDKEDSDIEDLLGAEFYLRLVTVAYNIDPLDAATFTSQHPRIAKRVEQHFAEHGINGGKFSHYRPAEYLREHPELLAELDDGAVDAAARLVERLNSLIRP